ncbi:MAG: TrmH family RNA methyltransferase, partial [Alphaproteobacteria bacterium]
MTREPRTITSLTNERVKAIRALGMRKERRETGLFVAEGASIVVSARDAGFTPETLVVRAGAAAGSSGIPRSLIEWALGAGAEVLAVSEPVLEKLASKDNPQAMLGVFRQRWAEPPEPAAVAKEAVWLVLEEVRDPGNLGTIVR